MPQSYTKEQIKKIFNNLPEELKNAVISEETADNVFNTCADEELEYEQVSEVARYVGRVLMGLIPSEDFQETIEREVKIKKEIAKKITRTINRFVFYPVKELISSLDKISITKEEGDKSVETKKVVSEESIKENKITSDSDSYREIVE